MSDISDFRAVILAGGSGERFWPLSTPERPKQFLNVFGGETLIRQAYLRLSDIVRPENFFVVTSAELKKATCRELPELPAKNVVGEPMRRDTGAAVALGVGLAGNVARASSPLREDTAAADPVIGFFSSDQLVLKPAKFRAAVKKAVAIARRRATVVTLGIRPTCPATQFGYVDPKIGTFVEKPDEKTARAYLKKGYLWNAGMFIARASTFRAVFGDHAPALLPLTAGGAPSLSCNRLRSLYEKLPKISFDYAVMEKLDDVSVVAADCGWDDVGGYGAFDRYFPHDEDGNVRDGECNIVESGDNICISRAAKISLLGVKNLVVVTTPDHVLVVDKSRVSEMKKLFRR